MLDLNICSKDLSSSPNACEGGMKVYLGCIDLAVSRTEVGGRASMGNGSSCVSIS